MLNQDITKKRWFYKLLEPKQKLNIREDKKYKVEIIKDSTVYASKVVEGQLLRLYYIVS